ncbi:MAG: diguanylate cyclase [Planctomycetaceae bacterium]|nr:diguanylate cyclase [Planctomycetaceae bacterium]
MKVLIIDDSPDALQVAKARLAKEQLSVVCADGGKAGLEAARRENPDLILLDVDMPEMCGFDVCRALKSDPDLCMIPVLFLSGSAAPEDKVQGLDLGAIDYVAKPFDAFELRARVRAALRTKHLQDLLIEHAHIDPLTGLPNRRALNERLQCEWARVERHGGQMSFIMADIDHFKTVNDRFGHQVGDRLLQEISQVIAGQCRKTDIPSRLGGDEFAILVPDEKAENAAHLAERCRRRAEMACVVAKNGAAQTTVSFGIADSRGVDSPEALIARADEALYRAKGSGRNRLDIVIDPQLATPAAGAVAPTVCLSAENQPLAT